MVLAKQCRGLPSSRDSVLPPPPPPFVRGLQLSPLSGSSQRTGSCGRGHTGSSPPGFLHQIKARGTTLSCRHSSLAVTGALATYEIPPQHPAEPQQQGQQRKQQRDGEGPMPRWLSQGISEAVAHLDQAPFLQLLVPGSADSYLRHRVTTAVVQSPPLWHGIAQHLAKAAPDILILIHPMHRTPDKTSHRALEAARRSGQERGAGVLTGIAIGDDHRRRSEHDARMAATARAFRSGLAAPALSGRIGDCCDEDAELPFTNALATRREEHSHAHGPIQEGDFQTEYWGVVVQTKWASHADGCYILKTMRSGAGGGGCTCTHYSMVSVCKGEPYSAQLSACWLI